MVVNPLTHVRGLSIVDTTLTGHSWFCKTGQVHKEHLDRTLVKYYFECAMDMIKGHAFVYLVEHHSKVKGLYLVY